MPPRKDPNKPKGAASSYAFFVQTCREEHRKKHPDETIKFSEFSRKCSERWKKMNEPEKKRFEDMAQADRRRYEREMQQYDGTPAGKMTKAQRKRTKDPNAPKRPMSAFFMFCGEMRPEVRAESPGLGVGDYAKILGKRWEQCVDRTPFEQKAIADKQRYDKEMTAYKAGGGGAPKKARPDVPPPPPVEDDDDDDDEEDDDDDDDE